MQLPPASLIPPGNDWEEPIPLGSSPLPCFPIKALPQVLHDFVGALAAKLEVPPDLPAIAVLGVLAGAVVRKVAVKVQRGWEEPLMLYLAVALPPGNLKSTAFKKAVRPLLEAERKASEGMQLEVQLNSSKKKGWHKAIDELEQKLGRAGENAEGVQQNIAEMHQKLASLGRDTLPRYFCEDVTAEKLAELMADSNGRMVLMRSEGGGPLQMMTGCYCRPGQANIEIYLKGHSGDDLTIDRKNSLPVHVKNLSLTMVLTVQPSVLKGLIKNPALDERGGLPRFLFSLPRSLVGERSLRNCPAPQAAVDAYGEVVQRLCALEAKDACTCAEQPHHLLAMTPEAQQAFLVFRHRLEKISAHRGSWRLLAASAPSWQARQQD